MLPMEFKPFRDIKFFFGIFLIFFYQIFEWKDVINFQQTKVSLTTSNTLGMCSAIRFNI